MKDITFNYDGIEFITFIDSSGEPWFSAQEACKILKHTNPSQAIKNNCEIDGISSAYTLTAGGRQKVLIINESNLYRLMFKSRLESAKKFQKWVFETVLPSIRKTGGYSIPQSLKEKSKEDRKALTSEWKRHGIESPADYAKLTRIQYGQLNFPHGKRKKDFTKEQILTLSALEAMESLKLFYDNRSNGFDDCKNSIIDTSKKVKELTNNDNLIQEK